MTFLSSAQMCRNMLTPVRFFECAENALLKSGRRKHKFLPREGDFIFSPLDTFLHFTVEARWIPSNKQVVAH